MKDYRLLENRREYFDALYKLNLVYGVMPGLVYLYMPELAKRYRWGVDEKLWFAFLNGLTQNPITSLILFHRLPGVPPAGSALSQFEEWFNENWHELQFDVDRRFQKKETVNAIKTYAKLVEQFGSQEAMLRKDTPYSSLWSRVRDNYYSFGRLSSFSYLEYVYLNGFGSDCDNLLFNDKSGSKSHRNGMFFLLGKDYLVWDKRQVKSHDGDYPEFNRMCDWLNQESNTYLAEFSNSHQGVSNIGNFTLESNLCTFKNHFYGRRYPGVYSDMAQERIEWAEIRKFKNVVTIFKQIREDKLPEWLRSECSDEHLTIPKKAVKFAETGFPYRGEYFL